MASWHVDVWMFMGLGEMQPDSRAAVYCVFTT